MTDIKTPETLRATSASNARPIARKIRLSIPFWGDQYLERAIRLCLPALLAPGNVPALADAFEVEIALVTESRFFETLRQSTVYRRLQEHADVSMIELDDLLTNVGGDYGPVLTFALIRGYEDLGERMLDYFLLFLNADFILADGCYRTVVRLIRQGERVIHSPSFRVVLEDAEPLLSAELAVERAALSIPPRRLMEICLRYKHISVKARTINQKLFHQKYMDQFYWFVDENTLLGYQWPIALVGLQPERVVVRPRLMFDYGFIPEICPTSAKHYIGDSDEFCMLELQERKSGQDLLRLGWTTPGTIAAYLSDYSTREQRECGEQMHVFHSADLPPGLGAAAAESRKYVEEIMALLGPAKPHDAHPMFAEWWGGVLQRMEEARAHHEEQRRLRTEGRTLPAAVEELPAGADADAPLPAAAQKSELASSRALVKGIYRAMFGDPSRLRRTHPLWLENYLLSDAYWDEIERGGKILWVSERRTALADLCDRFGAWLMPSRFARDLAAKFGTGSADATFDACVFDLTAERSLDFKSLYEQVRPHLRDGGNVYLQVTNLEGRGLPHSDLGFCDDCLPDKDVSELVFAGGRSERALRDLYVRISSSRSRSRILRMASRAAALLMLSAPAYFLNQGRAARESAEFTADWLVMFARFRVAKHRGAADVALLPEAVPDLVAQA